MSIAGIIFDMDGVLCDSESYIAEAACQMFAETYRVTVQPEDFRPFIGTGEDRFLGGVAEKYGVTLSMPRDKDRTYAIYLDIIKGRMTALPGVIEFIRICRQRGLKLAVATSADRVKLDGNLAEIGVPTKEFDAVVTGNEITHKKPDPEIFRTAAARLGLVAGQCLVIEDAVNGVLAAKAAGCRCVGLLTSFTERELESAGADCVASGLAELTQPGRLERLLGSR